MSNRLETIEDIVAKYAVVSSPIKSRFYIAFGVFFVILSIIGVWVPGWPTISWAVPAAFFFSISNERLFRWSLTNRYFGPAIFEYYATGKTLKKHVKFIIAIMILVMSNVSAYLVWLVSSKGDGTLLIPSSWTGKDAYGFGAITILLFGFLGVIYLSTMVKSRK